MQVVLLTLLVYGKVPAYMPGGLSVSLSSCQQRGLCWPGTVVSWRGGPVK
jgi:hypothetical protein